MGEKEIIRGNKYPGPRARKRVEGREIPHFGEKVNQHLPWLSLLN